MLETKYIVFGGALLIGVPIGIVAAYLSQKVREFFMVLLVLATAFPTGNTDIELVSRDWYRGTTRGLEFTVVDICAMILFGVVLLRGLVQGRRWVFPPSLILIVVYCFYCLLSVLLATPWIFGTFELLKVFRGAFLFIVVFYFVEGDRERRVFLFGLSLAIIYANYMAMDERFVQGRWRIGGTFGHPNMLSIYSCLCAPILFSSALAAGNSLKERVLYGVSAGLAVVNVLLSVSRTGFVVVSLLVLLVGGLSIPRLSKKQRRYAWVGLIVIGSGIAMGSGNFVYRWQAGSGQFDNSAVGDRQVYWSLLAVLIEEPKYFWVGAGLNNWSYIVTNEVNLKLGRRYTPYESTDTKPESMRYLEAPAHSIIVLTIGELGVIGLFFFIAMWGRWLQMGMVFLYRRSEALVATLGLGCMLGLLGVFMQCITEWAFRHSSTYLLSHIVLGVMAAVYYPWSRRLQ